MALEIKEYIGSVATNINGNNPNNINLTESNILTSRNFAKNSIMQDIEGIHVGPSRNFNWYTEQALDSSIESWTKPYNKPLIMHHNEQNGKIIGRIIHAQKITENTRSGTPAILFTCNVPDKEGKEEILDGRLETVSIGVIAHDVRCSICGEPIELDEYGNSTCGHVKGNIYNGKTCYWNIYSMEAKELSYVIVPSDIYAHNIRTYDMKNNTLLAVNEKYNYKGANGMSKQVKDIVESVDIHEEDKKQATDKDVPQDKKEQDVKENKDKQEEKKEEKQEKKQEEKQDDKEKEIEDLKAEIEKLKSSKKLVEDSLLEVKKELEKVNVELEKAIEENKKEVQLKESLEQDLIASKQEVKEAYKESLLSLRESLNKPVITKESLEGRSLDSIKDSILDLKEEMNGQGAKPEIKIQEAQDPTLKSNKNTDVDVKESKKESNIDLREGLEKIMNSLII